MQCAQEDTLGNQKHLSLNLTGPRCDETDFTHAGFFSVLTVSVIYYGLQMSGYTECSGYLRNFSLQALPDQETCKKSKLNVSGVAVARVHREGQDNSLRDPTATEGKLQPIPRNCVRKVLTWPGRTWFFFKKEGNLHLVITRGNFRDAHISLKFCLDIQASGDISLRCKGFFLL